MNYRDMVVELLEGVDLLKGRVDPLAAPRADSRPGRWWPRQKIPSGKLWMRRWAFLTVRQMWN